MRYRKLGYFKLGYTTTCSDNNSVIFHWANVGIVMEVEFVNWDS